MIWSRYNYLFKSEKYGYLLYNSLSNAFLHIPDKSIGFIKEIQNNPNLINEYDEKEYFQENKIIVENDDDEIAVLKVCESINRYTSNSLGLTIAPTLGCNFRCSYCFELNKQGSRMSTEIQQAIVKYVKKRDFITDLSVTWYGGEPLLCMDIIEHLTKEFLSLGKRYNADIVTNGYLLSIDVFRQLQKLKVYTIQITLDGLAETHNKRRPHANTNNSFEQIINNLDTIIPIKENTDISIRVNIDKKNKNEFPELYFFLQKRYKNSVFVYPAFVENLNGTCKTSDCMQDVDTMTQYLIELYNNYGIYDQKFFPKLTYSSCMVRDLRSYVVDPLGKMYKCWNDIGIKGKEVADITEDKIINQNLLARYLKGADKMDSSECAVCHLYPVCSGGCPYHRLLYVYNKKQVDFCHIGKHYLEKLLEIHYDWKMKQQNSYKK